VAGLSFRASDSVTFSTGPGLEFVRFGSGSPFAKGEDLSEDDELLASATFGSNPRNPFVLPTWEARLVIDWRDGANNQDPNLDPRGGYYYVAAIRQAIPFLEGGRGFGFTDLYAEGRFYRSIQSRDRRETPATLALRLKGKWVPSLLSGDLLDTVPYSERAFMGGALDMRGFRINQVGAYDCVCLARTEEVVYGPFFPFIRRTGVERLVPNPTFLPRGGRFSALASGEIRFRNDHGQGFALFADAGVLGSKIIEILRLDRSLRWDVGLGYRQSTPVGPVRIDLALRPAYPEDRAPLRPDEVPDDVPITDDAWFRGRTFGCDAFPDERLTRRVPGGFPGFPISDAWNGPVPPVVFNLSIAIGEAI
jgi:outer membrane protein assembly factor BamA